MRHRTPEEEERRYNAVWTQLQDLSDQAAQSRNPALAILYGLLLAEMYDRNEDTHTVYQARSGIIEALQWRIARMLAANFEEAMNRLLTMPATTREEWAALSQAILDLAKGD